MSDEKMRGKGLRQDRTIEDTGAGTDEKSVVEADLNTVVRGVGGGPNPAAQLAAGLFAARPMVRSSLLLGRRGLCR
jgi:hypothetical protein